MTILHAILSAIRIAITGGAYAVIGLSSVLLVFLAGFGGIAEEVTSGGVPHQFYSRLEAPHLASYRQVFAIAHNAGDTVATTKAALAHHARAIEIDVAALGGQLYAAHLSPLPVIGKLVFRGPTLTSVWDAAHDADLIVLDLDGPAAGYLDLLFAFLAEHHTGKQVAVVSGDAAVLAAFKEQAPTVLRFLSIMDRQDLASLQTNAELVTNINGVSVREDLVDREIVAWLKQHGLLVNVWTVNDLTRVNALVQDGVDSVTTDNLAILELLAGQDEGI